MNRMMIRNIVSSGLLLVSILLCYQIIQDSRANQERKIYYAEVNHIKYGLFSIDAWKDKLSNIIGDEIGKLRLTSANQIELKKQVEAQLDVLIDKVTEKIQNANKGTAKGWMKQKFINAFVDIKDIKAGIPEYADAIIEQMTKQKNELKFKSMLKQRVEKYFDKTFELQDLTRLNAVLQKTQTTDIEDARIKLDKEILSIEKNIYLDTWLLIFLAAILFSMNGFTRKILPAYQYILMVVMLVLLLAAGVLTPMIDMEAKISEMSFMLVDHPISFLNQVLYFQSKSIMDVFWVMITHADLQMKAVGVLVVTFSVIFPIFKLLSSCLYYYNFRNLRSNKLIQFFVMKSGKWSMTDVLVVAIFMAYIGFNGIISSQFGNFTTKSEDVVILATNGTSLQPGFFIFLTYAILSLFLSNFLASKSPQT
jgi:Paraquat-inducible protein A